MQAVRTRAEEHRRTPMIGRTHGVHAEPMTFGLKLALWYAELDARRRRASARAREAIVGRQAVGRGRHVRAPAAVDRSGRLPHARPRAGAGGVAGDSARSPRRAAVGARHHRLVAREVRARDPRPAEDRDRRGRGAVRQGAEGLVGDAAQAQPDRLRADRRAGAAAARQRRRRVREQRALARARHLALVGRARDPARQLHRARSHAAALHADRGGHGGLSGSDAREPRALARRGVFRARCCWSWRGAASRASRRTSGCSATPCARSTSSGDFKALLLADADVTRGAAAGRDRARVRSRRAAAARRPHLRPCVRGSVSGQRGGPQPDACARVRHPQAVGVRSRRARPWPRRCTRSATPR